MRNFKNVLVVALLMVGTTLFAQTKLTGKVVDEYNQALPGADVIIKGTTQGTSSDFDGNFTLETSDPAGTLSVSFMGYNAKSLSFSGSQDFGNVSLAPSAESLSEVVIVGSGIIDLAADRKTPVAVTTIKATEIQQKAGNFDLPELLASSPSVQSVKRGGYGDGQMYLRGFDQTNTAFLLNGQPINGMEDGKMYWSNWSGVLDIANAVQVQRGLGSSKLAISSVGGTVNIVTKTVDKKAGGFVQGMVANDNYIKSSAYYSTGIMDNGIAVAAMLGHWQGDGYRNGTPGQGQTYYLSLGYKPNEKNIFNFLVTGAPQWHGDAWPVDLQTYLDEGRKFNAMYGYKDGEVYPGARNFYHKPIVNLSWDWDVSSNSSLSTVLYGSLGRGGYAYPTGHLWGQVSGEDGGIDFDQQVENNEAAGSALGYMRGSYNGHNWYGLVTNFEKELSDFVTMNIGADARFYNGLHFRAPTDLLGGGSFENTSTLNGTYTVDNVFGGYNPWAAVTNWNNEGTQHVGYDYEENINYYGIFGQIEYAKENFATFFQGSISSQSHILTNQYNFDVVTEADKISNFGFNTKAGLSLKLSENHTTFVNAGYYSRQPFHDNLYDNVRRNVDINELAGDENESVLGFEFGYKVNLENFNMSLNAYRTSWGNRIVTRSNNDDPLNIVNFQMSGVSQLHKGVELDFDYRAMDNFQFLGFVSLGDWKYDGDAAARVFDEEGNDITSSYGGDSPTLYLDNNKVGGAAQFSAGLGLKWVVFKNFKFDMTQRFYDKLYSNVSIDTFFDEDTKGAIRLPSYSITDAGLSYKLKLKEKLSLDFRLNVNNIADEFYIEYSDGGTHVTTGSETWNGIDTSNNVRIGYGRTWNFSTRFNF